MKLDEWYRRYGVPALDTHPGFRDDAAPVDWHRRSFALEEASEEEGKVAEDAFGKLLHDDKWCRISRLYEFGEGGARVHASLVFPCNARWARALNRAPDDAQAWLWSCLTGYGVKPSLRLLER